MNGTKEKYSQISQNSKEKKKCKICTSKERKCKNKVSRGWRLTSEVSRLKIDDERLMGSNPIEINRELEHVFFSFSSVSSFFT